MIIKDPALGKYSIKIGLGKHMICDASTGNSFTTVSDLNEALKNIASRIVADMSGEYTLMQYRALEDSTFTRIRAALEGGSSVEVKSDEELKQELASELSKD